METGGFAGAKSIARAFSTPASFPAPQSIVVDDFNRDGEAGTLSLKASDVYLFEWLLGDGTGAFDSAFRIFTGYLGPASIIPGISTA